MLTQEELKKQLHYDPETGIFTRLISNGNRAMIGSIAGHKNKRGYIEICINKKNGYLAHRLAFLYMTGNSPNNNVDHIDGIPHNNSWENLRPATQSENMQNIKIPINNKTGYLGVCLSKRPYYKPYRSTISINKKRIHLGYFDTALEASYAYKCAKITYHLFQPFCR